MTPGRPQQLPYVSPPDKKMSQEKSGSNIVVEWMSAIKEIAENGYDMNNIYLVMREKDNVVVSIMLNKSDHTYSFVNLTKGHICTCKFATFEDAIKDMEKKKDNGEVIDYIKLL